MASMVLFPIVSLLLVLASSSSWAAASPAADGTPVTNHRFRAWMEQHGKSYPTAEEEMRRFEVYRRNVERIEATNREGGLGYELGENKFTDLTSEEFLATYTGRYVLPSEMGEEEEEEEAGETVITTHVGDVVEGHASNLSALPESVDWRAKGAVTPVKDQQEHAVRSCWAFAVIAAVESLHQIKTGKLVTLSEQQLVDCGTPGCSVGTSVAGITWIKKNGGVTTEADYPYTGKKGACNANKLKNHAATVRDYRALRNNEQKLMEAVAQQPVTVAIEAGPSFQDYRTGVYSGPCGYTINHIVTAVGYGKDAATGKKYWIIKNSYGKSWGMGGYILMERGGVADPRGLCGVSFYPVWPTM